MTQNITIQITPVDPMTQKDYAALVNLPERTVREMVSDGRLPILKKARSGERVMIDRNALAIMAAQNVATAQATARSAVKSRRNRA